MKKKKRFITIIAILILMLIPIPIHLKDGGSIEYNAILYQYTKIHRLSETSSTNYQDGWELNILGIKIGENINTHEDKEQEIINKVVLEIKENTKTSKGATFVIKNNTQEKYFYGQSYIIEKLEDGNWKELNTLTGYPLSWNDIAYTLEPNEEKEVNINWSLGYGKLKSGTYRLVKHDLRKANSSDSRAYTVYAEFDIK